VTSGWQRLHPLSPVIRAGRGLVPLLVLVVVSTSGGHRSASSLVIDLVIVGATMVLGVINWIVTRWKLDGPTLRIESGLLRRDSRQLPVARIQAVDVIQPFLARIFGLAELRIRLAGSGSAGGRLAYLREPEAVDLRARLLAGHHGLDPATPAPDERVVASVPTARLVGSVALSAPTLVSVVLVVGVAVASSISRAAVVALGGSLVAYLFVLARSIWRRVSTQYGFTVAEAPDGIRIRRGLLGTVAETIPIRRVQAVRLIQPLLWRAFGWCRLEVDIAGSAGHDQGTRSGTVTKALLPVGPEELARQLLHDVVRYSPPDMSKPPHRVRWKAPLSYHFLAAGHDDTMAVSVRGRVRKVTSWVPLEKVQSIRWVQGPAQRALGLASVNLDAAGRRVRAEFLDRSEEEAGELFAALADASRQARKRTSDENAQGPAPFTLSPFTPSPLSSSVFAASPVPETGDDPVRPFSPAGHPPPGWYRDPTARHQFRYWGEGGWTEHVADNGTALIDPL
jgi:putative membrane protein